MRSRWRKTPALASVATIAVVALGASSTYASGNSARPLDDSRIVNELQQTVARQGEVNQKENLAVSIPGDSSSPVSLTTQNGKLDMKLPASGRVRSSAGVKLFDGNHRSTNIAVQPLEQGVRALIHIRDASAPERYDFTLGGSVAKLRLSPDGGVEALSRNGKVVSKASAPWALDAAGNSVPTRFEVRGRTLTQVVEHRGGNWAYGITADPSWWDIAKCAGAIAWFVGSTLFAISKILKVKSYIAALGGTKKAAELMLRASTWEERYRYGGTALIGLAAELSGIAAMSVCF